MHYLIQLGYVEDSIPGMLCLYYGNPHKTVGEALRSLRNVLREHLTEPKKPCCHKAPKGSNYCPTCGTHAPHLDICRNDVCGNTHTKGHRGEPWDITTDATSL